MLAGGKRYRATEPAGETFPRRAVPPQGPMTHRAVPTIKEQGLYDFSFREKEGKVIKSLLYGRIWGKMSVRKTK